MLRNTGHRVGLRAQGSASHPAVSPNSAGPGERVYAQDQILQRRTIAETQGRISVDVDEAPAVDDENDEQRIQEAEAAVLRAYEIIDLTEDDVFQQTPRQEQGCHRYRRTLRNGCLESSHRSVSACKFRGGDLKLKTCVELLQPVGKREIQFVEIKSIWASRSDGQTVIRGLPYARNRSLGGALENKKNEVCQILEVDADDNRPDETQALVEIKLEQILQVRTLHKTNAVFPMHRFGNDPRWNAKDPLEREDHAPLTCRWKHRIEYRAAPLRRKDKPDGAVFIRLTEAEASRQFACSDKELRVAWRGRTSRGGSYKPQVIQLDGPGVPMARNDGQYTFADVFCGAGGASRGAVMAGMKLSFGVDKWPVSCTTWRRNFPGARMFEMDMADFIQHREIDHRSHPIDILHLSPPCQFWSPLSNGAKRKNEENMAILFACSELIKKLRPRLFTVEQTFGLLQDQYMEFFNALVQQFTCHGYSVQWKIRLPLVEYGLPQTRQRLVMIGACPGEQLPPWPTATHSATPTRGKKSFVTEAQAIRDLDRRRVSLHDLGSALARNEPPTDGEVPLGRTITCGGAQGACHYSGRRNHTVRELACLQGFPLSHEFEGTRTAIKKQIGNAFPPCVVKVIYEHLRQWLERVDGIHGVPAQARVPPPRAPGSLDHHRRRSVLATPLPIEPQHRINGDLHEDEALALALQESKRGRHSSTRPVVVELSDDEGQQDSPVSVAPLLERMSIVNSDSPPGSRAASVPRSRSSSATLGFSPSPSPGTSRRPAASQKRSLDSMHDGEADEVMKNESPPKRERPNEAGGDGSRLVAVGRIPSKLPQYDGPRDVYDVDDECVAAGDSKRLGRGSIQKSHVDGSMPGNETSQGDAVVKEPAPRHSRLGGLAILSQTSLAGICDDEAWMF